MKLITNEIQQRFTQIGEQSQSANPIIVAKFFNPVGAQTWYASEYDPETKICFGYVTGMFENEWGYFSIDELESIKLRFGLGIERDVLFKETRFDDLMKKLCREMFPKRKSDEPQQER
jgi:hypothetical protein